MIQPSIYNCINFSSLINRESKSFDYDKQRKISYLPVDDYIEHISFLVSGYATEPTIVLKCHASNGVIVNINPIEGLMVGDDRLYYFNIAPLTMPSNQDVMFCLHVNSEVCYSEYYRTASLEWMSENDIVKVYALNNNDKYGFTYNQISGYFKVSEFNSDIFATKKTEYAYSYGRKLLLSAENQVNKRFVFSDLTMYEKNLLKWLCNCNSLYINDVKMQIISEFTDVEAEAHSEISGLQADFAMANQSFFTKGATKAPKDVFVKQFFN